MTSDLPPASSDVVPLLQMQELPWFRQINDPAPLWSMIVRVGSEVRFAQHGVPAPRDIDYFLVVPVAVQKQFSLPPVTTIPGRHGLKEISLYTSERLLEDALTGSGAMHWRDAEVVAVGCGDEMLSAAVKVAGTLSDAQRRRRAWTEYALFEIQAAHTVACSRRNDAAGAYLSAAAAIRSAGECITALYGYWENSKWIVHRLREVSPNVANAIEAMVDCRHPYADSMFSDLRSAAHEEMKRNGFSAVEMEHWESVNAGLLEFQLPRILPQYVFEPSHYSE